jgi:hypothetical protein
MESCGADQREGEGAVVVVISVFWSGVSVKEGL